MRKNSNLVCNSAFSAKIRDLIKNSERRQMAVFSDFCSPAEAACVLEEFKFLSGVNLRFFGGN